MARRVYLWKEGLTYDMQFRTIGGILDQREEEGTKRRKEGSMGERRNQQEEWGSSWEEGGTKKNGWANERNWKGNWDLLEKIFIFSNDPKS
jgi:hypothetical protein